jgi:hypothetical protein
MREIWIHELANYDFKVNWSFIDYEDGYLRGHFQILSVGKKYYVDDMENMLRDKLKELSKKYEYLSKAQFVFPEYITSNRYSFYIKAKLK